jgi:hypothetical protein
MKRPRIDKDDENYFIYYQKVIYQPLISALWLLTSLCTSAKREVEVAL